MTAAPTPEEGVALWSVPAEALALGEALRLFPAAALGAGAPVALWSSTKSLTLTLTQSLTVHHQLFLFSRYPQH